MSAPYDHEAQCALNVQHLRRPIVGDYWQEMFVPIARILMVDAKHVLVQKLAGSDPQSVYMTRRGFKKWLSYSHIPDRTWADVRPGGAA